MFLLLLLLFLTTLAFWNFVWKRRGLPPGPTPLPFFGNAFALKRSLYDQYQVWAKEYGPIYTIWVGEVPLVLVTDYELMREMFVKEGDVYAGRDFMGELFKTFSGEEGGVIRTEGHFWKVTRRFGLQTMRNLGVGRAALENKMIEDLDGVVEKLRKEVAANRGGKVDLQREIDRLIGSTINRVIFGYAFEDDNLEEFYELKHAMDQQAFLISCVTGRMMITMPWLRHIPVFAQTYSQLAANFSEIYSFLKRPILARISSRKEQNPEERGEPADLLDYFLDQMDSETNEYFTLSKIAPLCFDLFLAGQETTSTTLSFLVLYLLLDQRVQAKVHADLDRFEEEMEKEKGRNGVEQSITMADRSKLPYVNAVINETQRFCNLLPMNLTHRMTKDAKIPGGRYFLKKGTRIVPQICCVLYDEKIFPNPLRFEPERFLDDQGQLKRIEEHIPFGLGKRICMGESLARMELFLFTANFFRYFQVLPVDPFHPPSSVKHNRFSVRIDPYKCRLVLRPK